MNSEGFGNDLMYIVYVLEKKYRERVSKQWGGFEGEGRLSQYNRHLSQP